MRLVPFVLVCAACGGASEPVKPAAAPVPAVASPAPKPGILTRSQVKQGMSEGLGMFLRTVEVEPAFREGAFIGFKIRGFRDPARWAGIDLRPGDVVSKVNGRSIEKPDDALVAFKACESAKEVQVVGERANAAHTVVVPIVEDVP